MATFAEVIQLLGGTSTDQTPLTGVSSSTAPRPETVSFIRNSSGEARAQVQDNPRTLFLIPDSAEPEWTMPNTIRTRNPRLAYAKVLRDILATARDIGTADTAVVSRETQIDEGAKIGEFAVIHPGVVIGERSSVGSHAVIHSGVVIGSDCHIGSHTVIGNEGFGFEVDSDGTPIRIGHRGGVVIGNDVEVGSHVVIAQGTIEPTEIDDHVKIDDCVFIAHNVSVGEASFIIAGAEISGSVRIGKRAWVSPEATIINQVSIGDDALVGIGAVVVADVAPNTIVAGVPAKSRGFRYAR